MRTNRLVIVAVLVLGGCAQVRQHVETLTRTTTTVSVPDTVPSSVMTWKCVTAEGSVFYVNDQGYENLVDATGCVPIRPAGL